MDGGLKRGLASEFVKVAEARLRLHGLRGRTDKINIKDILGEEIDNERNG